jgi:hypothetical protein
MRRFISSLRATCVRRTGRLSFIGRVAYVWRGGAPRSASTSSLLAPQT